MARKSGQISERPGNTEGLLQPRSAGQPAAQIAALMPLAPATTNWAGWPDRTVTYIASYRLRFRRTANRVLAIWGGPEVQ